MIPVRTRASVCIADYYVCVYVCVTQKSRARSTGRQQRQRQREKVNWQVPEHLQRWPYVGSKLNRNWTVLMFVSVCLTMTTVSAVGSHVPFDKVMMGGSNCSVLYCTVPCVRNTHGRCQSGRTADVV